MGNAAAGKSIIYVLVLAIGMSFLFAEVVFSASRSFHRSGRFRSSQAVHRVSRFATPFRSGLRRCAWAGVQSLGRGAKAAFFQR